MLNKKLTHLMCSVGLVVAGGVFGSQAVLAHDHDDKKGDDMMMQADTNHDGMISAAEHAAYAQQMFDNADTNHDGMLSKGEMEAAHKKMHEEMEHHGKHHDDDAKDAKERSKKDDDAEDAAERK